MVEVVVVGCVCTKCSGLTLALSSRITPVGLRGHRGAGHQTWISHRQARAFVAQSSPDPNLYFSLGGGGILSNV